MWGVCGRAGHTNTYSIYTNTEYVQSALKSTQEMIGSMGYVGYWCWPSYQRHTFNLLSCHNKYNLFLTLSIFHFHISQTQNIVVFLIKSPSPFHHNSTPLPTLWLSPQPHITIRAGSTHRVSQQGWATHLISPCRTDKCPLMTNPPHHGLNQVPGWLNPKGETERVTQGERGKGRGEEKLLFSSLLLSCSHWSTGTWQLILTSCPRLSSFSSLPIDFHFHPVMRKRPLTHSLYPSRPPTLIFPQLNTILLLLFHLPL